jgi:hypothetical protein
MRLLLAVIGALAIIAAIVAAGFFFGGFYNVAASEDDPQIVAWALPKVRAASIDRHRNAAASIATAGRASSGPSSRKACAPIRPISRKSPTRSRA